jgi:3D-(3,5/4)-trihydroxycyclohexane-1,2-dione acylhydrolase (decyclizing)
VAELRAALDAAKAETRTTVIAVATDRYEGVPGYESWWDVPVAEVSSQARVQAVRAEYETARARERWFV